MRLLMTLIAVLLLNPVATAMASPQQFTSSAERVVMVELFTSEGCSSCPPADEWLSGLVDDERLWRTLAPVAFHVDYWDYIGWKDRFARKAFGERQRLYRQLKRVRSVYTPGFVVGGKEWRGWFRWPDLDVAPQTVVGPLVVSIDGAKLEAVFSPVAAIEAGLELHVAIVGFGITTDVRAGENDGRQLQHDFVALEYRYYAMASAAVAAAEHRYSVAERLPEVASASNSGKRRGLVAWVSVSGDPFPIQAVGGWLE